MRRVGIPGTSRGANPTRCRRRSRKMRPPVSSQVGGAQVRRDSGDLLPAPCVSFEPFRGMQMTTDGGQPIPRLAGGISRGDLFWIEPDISRGPPPSYPHPHVVVQEDVFNQSRITTVVVCSLTSNLHLANEPGNVLLEEGEGNLPRQSVVVVSQISSVEKARLGSRIGSLTEARVEQILDGLRFQQTSFFPR
jgi:mRNA interferase MazF